MMGSGGECGECGERGSGDDGCKVEWNKMGWNWRMEMFEWKIIESEPRQFDTDETRNLRKKK